MSTLSTTLRHLITTTVLLTQPLVANGKDHVLLVTIDDLNDWIGCLSDPLLVKNHRHVIGQGHPQAKTPHLDRLARRGTLFSNAHCQAPICRPSRISFMSGIRPTSSGIYANRPQYDAKGKIRPGKDVAWMTKRFEQAGYEIFTAGKLLHGSANSPLGGTPCFKTSQGPYPKNKIEVPRSLAGSIWDIGPFPNKEENYTDFRIAQWTSTKIAKPFTTADKPRFIALGFYNPHLPLFAPQKWFDQAPRKQDVILGATKKGDLDDLSAIAKRISTRVSFGHCSAWCLAKEKNMRTLTQAYLACTTAMDDALGKVITALDNSDMANNTWIVVLSDHGWHLGEKNHVAKQTLWTRSTRVPLIIVPPKRLKNVARGITCKRPAELLDVYPTLLAGTSLTPLNQDRKLDGISLVPWLKDPGKAKQRPAITTMYAHNHSVVNCRYRYIRYAEGSEELYDREADPHEFENLIQKSVSDPNLRSIIENLSSYLPKNEAGKPDLVDDRVNH